MLIGAKDSAKTMPERQYAIFVFLFALAVFMLPIDWIAGVGAFGEYSIMSSFYVFLPLVCLAGPLLVLGKKPSFLAPEVIWFAVLMSAAFAISALVNMPDILGAELKGRAGIGKVATTAITFFFSVALTVVTAALARQPGFVRKALIRPVCIALILFFIVGTVEILGRYSGFMEQSYLKISHIFRSGYVEASVNDGRLRSVSGEPASAALYLAFALVWLHAMVRVPNVGGMYKAAGFALTAATILFFVLTGARTAYILLLGLVACRLAYPFLLKFAPAPAHRPLSLLYFLMFCAAFTALYFLSQSETIAASVTQGDSVSNLSRYASNYTAFSLFSQNPLIGVGPGQYAFAAQYGMPAWGWTSWEIRDWFTDPARAWPPVFSLPGRLACEFGILGVLAWYVPLIELFRRLLQTVRQEKRRLGSVPAIGTTLLVGMTYALLQGFAQDSFRFFEIWIILGVVSAYVSAENPETRFCEQQSSGKDALHPSFVELKGGI